MSEIHDYASFVAAILIFQCIPGPGSHFRQAFAVSLTNPKVMLFFVAFFPLFLRPGASLLTLGIMMLHVTVLSLLYQGAGAARQPRRERIARVAWCEAAGDAARRHRTDRFRHRAGGEPSLRIARTPR